MIDYTSHPVNSNRNKLVSMKRRKYDSKNSIGKLKHLEIRMLSFKKGKTKQNLHNSESKGASKLINTKLCNAKIKETPNTYMETLT